jgi:hypothetical protein
LTTFQGRRILGGFSETNPTPDGFGEWVRDNSNHNSQPLTPRHASRIAAILVAERYAGSDRDGNAVIIKFDSSGSPKRTGSRLAFRHARR